MTDFEGKAFAFEKEGRVSVALCLGLLDFRGRVPAALVGMSRSQVLSVVETAFRSALRGTAAAWEPSTFSAFPWYSIAYASESQNVDEQGQAEPAAVIVVGCDDVVTSWMVEAVAASLALIFDQRSVAFIGSGVRLIDRWGRDESERNNVVAAHRGARAGAFGLDAPSDLASWAWTCREAYREAHDSAAAAVSAGEESQAALFRVGMVDAFEQVLFVTGGDL